MELSEPSFEPNEQAFVPEPETPPLPYPPKYEKKEQAASIWMRSIVSLALYLLLGYFIFPSYKMLLIITAIVVVHELGHFLAMKYYRYSDLGIFFIPLLGAYVSGTKREVSQRQSAVILLAGPLPGILLGIGLYLLDQYHGETYYPFDIPLWRIAEFMIILNLINLFPLYPLDGGQLLNRVFLDEESWISKIFVVLSAAFMCWIAWKLKFYVLFIFPVMMLLRLRGDSQFSSVDKRIEAEGINADISYKDLPDADYWRIRTILMEEHASFRDIAPGPPYQYSEKEEKIMNAIQSLLHRHLIQDVSLAGKVFIFLIWAAAIASPWLLNMDMSYFQRFGF